MILSMVSLITAYIASILYSPQIGVICGFLVLVWHQVFWRRIVKYTKR